MSIAGPPPAPVAHARTPDEMQQELIAIALGFPPRVNLGNAVIRARHARWQTELKRKQAQQRAERERIEAEEHGGYNGA
jgi:F0F1-type ATP synthase epsilon subunit